MTLQRKSILLIDDDRGILKSFREILESEGYDVDTAEAGFEAIERCKAHSYRIVVIDIKLPDIVGTYLLAMIHEALPGARKIIITGYPTLENAIESVNLHADAYLIKPVNPEEFLKVIAENVNKQMEAETMSEDKVMKWVESRYVEAKRSQSQRKVLASQASPEGKE